MLQPDKTGGHLGETKAKALVLQGPAENYLDAVHQSVSVTRRSYRGVLLRMLAGTTKTKGNRQWFKQTGSTMRNVATKSADYSEKLREVAGKL
jgi:hypothetical protein